VRQVYQNGKISWEEKQSKLYQLLVQMIYENKRTDNYIEEYTKRQGVTGRLLRDRDNELGSLKMKRENTKHQLVEISA
jgi:hypothetical protein